MDRLSVTWLGPPEVHRGGQPVTFPTRKVLAMLVYLVTEGGSHSRDKLAALFWPESEAAAARATLRSTLARLRHAIEAGGQAYVVVNREAVGFDFGLDFELDLERVQAAFDLVRASPTQPGEETHGEDRVAALEVGASRCRGEFLEGFTLPDAPEFDDWVTVQREAWLRRMELVLDRLSEWQADVGRSAAAIETTSRWIALSPLQERAHRRLMQLCFTAGDRSAALRAYEACRALLGRELGTGPAPETEALAERIRAALAPGRAPPAMEPGARPAALDIPFVGRADKLSALIERYHAARRGEPQVVVLEGEAGIGKTRLATEFVGWAVARGADALQGRAFETGGRLPYQPLVDAFRPRLERENAPEDLVSDVWLTELARLLPELRDRYPDLPAPAGDDAAARTRLFEAIARLGQALVPSRSGAPLVLFVDDVHWADAASLDVLHYGARRWGEEHVPVIVLLTLRSEALAATPGLGEWLLGLERDVHLTRLTLGPLTSQSTLELVQALSFGTQSSLHSQRTGGALADGPEALEPELRRFGQRLFDETAGQPFFVAETLKALLDHGALVFRWGGGRWVLDLTTSPVNDAILRGVIPRSVRDLIRGRLARLSPPARALVTAAAVLGRGFTFEEAIGTAGVHEDDALPGLDEALQAHLLREDSRQSQEALGAGYLFVHDRVRDVVYAEAGEARRRVFHRRALDTLQPAGAPAAELARHAAAAGLLESAVHFTTAAGDEAMQLLAARDAASYYGEAIALAENSKQIDLLPELHARRGRAFTRVAMWADAKRELEAALEGVPGREERRAEILVDLLEASFWLLDVPAMRQRATEAVTLAAQTGRADLEISALGWLAAGKSTQGDVLTCIEECRRAMARARDLGVGVPIHVHSQGSLSLYWLGHFDEAAAWSREAIATAQAARDMPMTLYSLPHLGLALAGKGHYDEAAVVFEQARQLGREYGMDALQARAIAMSAGFHLDVFDFAGAEALAQEARERALSLGFPPPVVSAGIDLLLNFARQRAVGRTEGLVDEVAEAAEQAAGFHGWLWRLRLAEARAEIALVRDEPGDALRWVDEAIERSRAQGRRKYEALGLVTRGRALAALGRTREAIGHARRALRLARAVGDPALLLRAAGLLLEIDGDDRLAAEVREVIARISSALPDPHLRSCFEAGEPVRELGRRV